MKPGDKTAGGRKLARIEHLISYALYGIVKPPAPVGSGDITSIVNFGVGSAPLTVLGTLYAGKVVTSYAIIVVTPFDDLAATAAFGVSAAPSAFQVPLTEAGQFCGDSAIVASVSDTLLMTLSLGASSIGSGILLYTVG